MTASVTGSPRYCSASRLSFARIRAEISCGVYFLPSTSTVQVVPMWRLTLEIVRSTFVTACRLAVSPTSTSPSLVKATTDGVVRKPSAFAMTVGSPPSSVATTEFVVPRSIPTALAMGYVLFLKSCGRRLESRHIKFAWSPFQCQVHGANIESQWLRFTNRSPGSSCLVLQPCRERRKGLGLGPAKCWGEPEPKEQLKRSSHTSHYGFAHDLRRRTTSRIEITMRTTTPPTSSTTSNV